MPETPHIISVTPQNVDTYGLFCVKSKKNPGHTSKLRWFLQEFPQGLRLKILQDEAGRQLGFMEYTTAEHAWRPVEASNHLFIHCMFIYKNEDKGKGSASLLIQDCIEDARQQGKAGVVAMCSDGAWITNKRIFLKNGFRQVDQRGRFELMQFPLTDGTIPQLKDWEGRQGNYKGWHLLYAHQCPWHQKCVEELQGFAEEVGIQLQVTEITEAAMAQSAPSGFGVFALLKDGQLLEDHYISKTRFRNIIQSLV
ncbi:MAG: hypothetical protein KDD02_16260 [Phaeodactylibacter sp.]|nr:hypothetical protein [Phaeodactylibacter sp.]MCB9302271.1 hypothetical protein [Lewinellaceae bacterium]